jgi:hypothetical protein
MPSSCRSRPAGDVPSRSPPSPWACCLETVNGSRSWAAGPPGLWHRPTRRSGSPRARARRTPSPPPRCPADAPTTGCSPSPGRGRRPRSSRCWARSGEGSRPWRSPGTPGLRWWAPPTRRSCSTSPTNGRWCRPASPPPRSPCSRASLGQDLGPVIAAADQAVVADRPAGLLERTQFTFLGSGWTVGLANEAALKLREACSAWAESYPAMEYRHGPISIPTLGARCGSSPIPRRHFRRRLRPLMRSWSPPPGIRWPNS